MHNASMTRNLARGVAVFCLGLALAGCGLASGHGSVSTGEKYQAEGKYRAAYIEAKKVLQRDDKNGEAWLLLGQASLMLGNPKDAMSDLDHARSHGVPEARWAVPVGRTLLVSQQFGEILKTLPADLQAEPATRARVDVLRGDAQRALKQPDQAKQSYDAALKLDPKASQALVGLARLAEDTHDTDAANKYVEQALAAASDNPQAWVAKGDLAFAGGDFAGAEANYDKALAIKNADWLPQDAFYARARLVEAQTRQSQYDKALANIDTMEKMAPEMPYTHYLHAVVLYQQGHLDDAVTQLQQVLKAAPNNVPAQMLMGAVNYAQADYGQAEMNLSNVLGVDGQNVAARKLLALTFYREGRSQQALGTLRPAVPGNPTDPELLALLQRATAEGAGLPPSMEKQHAAGQAGQIAVATSAPTGPFAKVGEALAAGNLAEAIRLLKAMPAGDAQTEAQRTTLLVEAYVRNHQVDQGLKTAADYAAAHPRDSAAHLLYGTALIAGNKRDQARAQYDEAVKLDPKNFAALMSVASLDILEHQYKNAAGRYDAILKQDPKNVPAMTALAKLAAIQGDRAEAIKQYKTAIAAAPKSPESYVGLILLYSQAGQFDDAAGVARQLAQALPDNQAALNALGAAELNAGKHADALKPLEQAVKLAPQVPLYRINLARAQVLDKKPKVAQANLEQVIKADPGQVQAVSLLAFMKLQDHDLPGALALAKGLQKQANGQAVGLALEGDLYMADKSWAKAAQAYKAGLKADYSRPLVVKTFVALNQRGTANADGVLKDWLAKHSDDAAMRLLLAQYYLDHQQNAPAAAQYETVLKAFPSNVDALNNLAWIYTGQKNPKALVLAEKAHKLAPTSPAVQDTYGWALLAADQPKAALPVLEQAAKAAPDAPAIQYHLAVAQARAGDKTAALATLADLQKSKADFSEKPAAEKLYAELGGK